MILELQKEKGAIDWTGTPLVQDGILGDKTRWYMGFRHLPQWRKNIIMEAQSYIGIRELSNNNRGPDIDCFLGFVDAPLGSPWCAAFASWCLSQSGLTNVPKSAGARRLGQLLITTTDPQPGDYMWFPVGSGWAGHCGIVVAVGEEYILTIEGNLKNMCDVTRRVKKHVNFGTLSVPKCDISMDVRLTEVSGAGTR